MPAAAAAVRLSSEASGTEWKTVTSTDGSYSFLAVPPGAYALEVSLTGFQTLIRRGIELGVGARLQVDLQLELGEIGQSVDINFAVAPLQASRGTVGFAVEQRKIANLPLDGRNFVPLIALAPGVSLPPGSVLPRVNGSRPRVSEYIYDGISVLQPEPGQVAYYPIIDAIEEFRIETNSYSAEYGRSNGGVILVHQKSGTNELHGTLFEFFRNEALNARNLFATTGPKPLFRRNQYGFVLGGPIQKNRTFLFTDWQGTRLGTGVVRQSTVPTLAQRQGILPSGTIPISRQDPVGREILLRYPEPNVTGATANNYRRTGTERTSQDQFDGRIDRYNGTSHRLFGRYAFLCDSSRPVSPLPDGSGSITSGVIGDTLTRANSLAGEHSWTVNPRLVNQLRFGWTRRGFERRAMRSGDSFDSVFPTYEVVGYQQIGPPANSNAEFDTSVTQVIDTLSWITGLHNVRAGADIRLQRLNVLQPPNPAGRYQFSSVLTGHSVVSLVLGQVQEWSADLQTEKLRPRATVAEFFLQDDWRVSSRLALNLGVRYTLNFPSTVAGDRGAVFDLDSERLRFLGQDGYPRTARELEKLNVAPRIGLSYRVTESFVVRSGYGLTWIEQAGITTPFTTPLFPFIRTVAQSSLDNVNPAFVLSRGPSLNLPPIDENSGLGQGVFAVDRQGRSGYAQQWNLSLQKTFGTDWSMEAGYLGSKLTNLGVPDVNLNQLRVEDLALGAQLTQQAPNPFFGEIPISSAVGRPTVARQQLLRPYPRFTTVSLYRNNVGHSTYHSFQSRVEKRFSVGLTFTASYTFSRLIDDAGAVFDSAILTGPAATFQAADSHNRRLEKDVSTGNIPHIFSSGFVWETPFRGVQLAGIVRAQSGSPVAVTQQPNLNAFAGFGIQRPNRIEAPAPPGPERTTGQWFNTAAFTAAPQFTLGNSSRNPVVGPGYRTLDLMIGKTFNLTDRLRTELRVEAFNVTNTPPLGNPNGSFGTAAFGSITTALDPRVFEIVLKVHF